MAMKVLAFILAVYTLVLTAVPCIDVPEEHQARLSGLSAQHDQEQHHQAGADHCSPFCTCNCCATPVIIRQVTVEFVCFPLCDRQDCPVSVSKVVSPVLGFWQPPKIG